MDVGKFGMVPKGVGAPPRTRGGQRGRLPSAEGWAGAENKTDKNSCSREAYVIDVGNRP